MYINSTVWIVFLSCFIINLIISYPLFILSFSFHFNLFYNKFSAVRCKFSLLGWDELWTDKMIIYCWNQRSPLLRAKNVVIILINLILTHFMLSFDSYIFQNAFNPLQVYPSSSPQLRATYTNTHMHTHIIKCTWGLWQIRPDRCSQNWTEENRIWSCIETDHSGLLQSRPDYD